MKHLLLMCGLFTMAALSAGAQAPAGATGQCKDGSYSTAASKAGACRGHKGVQAWYSETSAGAKPAVTTPAAAQKASPTPAATPVPTTPAPARAQAVPVPSTPAAAPAPTATPRASTAPKAARGPLSSVAQAPGGGPGMVWVNTKSKVYHCSGDAFYGKTKAGKYVTEDAAKAEGDKADAGKPCAK